MISGLSDAQLGTPYRDGGWTVRQVVHHLAESHLNAYLRTTLALTKDRATINPYDEQLWAGLPDNAPSAQVSAELLGHLHARWTALLSALNEEQWQRSYVHPVDGSRTVEQLLQLYVWHGQHPIAQLQGLRERADW